ncbi:hypothetical protein [Demequina sp.]|uniref:hypothetical protein n=1 Tax=Demequina sp. TaxID=2050685 RepID=UPI0025BE3BF8|nr:hypothetical protein [Demequina sp.]
MANLPAMGIALDPWQIKVMVRQGLVDPATASSSKVEWRRRYQLRRLARLWRTEARVLLRRGMDEVLDDETWAGLQAEAETLRKCADRLLEEVSARG